DQYHLIGNKVLGIGYEDLVTGATTFVHDLELPGMLHARVVRPPGYHARLQELNEKDVREMPGVVGVVKDGSFLAVVCEREEQAVQASKRLSGLAIWDECGVINTEDIFIQLKKNNRQSLPVIKGVAELSAVPSIKTPQNSSKSITAIYQRPYHMHGSVGPSAAMALYENQEIKVWTHSQGVYPLRLALADVLEIEENRIHVVHVPAAGCYGHNGADDAALDAVLAARAFPGKPVL
ncbi:MAG: molybdopterin-dependent oxidoreductase, partial [Desulfatiglandales bacterium]|nr:molybdopterin-dependent oxidoreductase [Desulfatiglandales bacterium]